MKPNGYDLKLSVRVHTGTDLATLVPHPPEKGRHANHSNYSQLSRASRSPGADSKQSYPQKIPDFIALFAINTGDVSLLLI